MCAAHRYLCSLNEALRTLNIQHLAEVL